jgi:ribose 5-phosphate isomerase B
MKIAVGSDHRGLDFKKCVIECLEKSGHSVSDCGSYSEESVDYPIIAKEVCRMVSSLEAERGVLICGTGIGMSIAANKVKGIRAALCTDAFAASRCRLHNNANIICFGAERGTEGVEEMLQIFLTAEFEGGRHQRRLDEIEELERGQ